MRVSWRAENPGRRRSRSWPVPELPHQSLPGGPGVAMAHRACARVTVVQPREELRGCRRCSVSERSCDASSGSACLVIRREARAHRKGRLGTHGSHVTDRPPLSVAPAGQVCHVCTPAQPAALSPAGSPPSQEAQPFRAVEDGVTFSLVTQKDTCKFPLSSKPRV